MKNFFKSKNGNYNISKIVLFSIIGLFVIVTIFNSFTIINSGEVGLKVRLGKITDSSITEGVNFKIPFIEKNS